MGMKEVKILSKLSLFFIIEMLIQGSLGLFIGLLVLPNLRENIEYIFYEHYFKVGFNFFAVSLIVGAFIVVILTVLLSFYISFKLIDLTIGWEDVKEKFPKLFSRKC